MRNKNFFMLSNRIFSLGLKPKEFAVYCCLVRHSDREKNNSLKSVSRSLTILSDAYTRIESAEESLSNATIQWQVDTSKSKPQKTDPEAMPRGFFCRKSGGASAAGKRKRR